MAAYVIAIIDVTNAESYKDYARQVPATIAKYGGRYLTFIEGLEGPAG